MKNIPALSKFAKTLNFPHQFGVFLAANAVADACVLSDGLNGAMLKADYIAGNHDLFSTLLSPDGCHRIICSMSGPLPQKGNHDRELGVLLKDISDSGLFSAILLTGLPFMRLSGVDYEGIAAGVSGKTPVADVSAGSYDSDWLEGYDRALTALIKISDLRKNRKKPRTAAIAGYFWDRNEKDHSANLAELKRLLSLCGIELACVFPSGNNFKDLKKAGQAGLVVSLPYGRTAAAQLAAATGADLIETGLPVGLKGTTSWLSAVRGALGLRGSLPREVWEEERAAAGAISPALDMLAFKKMLFAGDPHLYAAMAAFASELRIKIAAAFINSLPVPLGTDILPETLIFNPEVEEARGARHKLQREGGLDFAAGNSFAITEKLAEGLPFVEFGFPSYSHHCLYDEPFMGYAGARVLASRMLNCLRPVE